MDAKDANAGASGMHRRQHRGADAVASLGAAVDEGEKRLPTRPEHHGHVAEGGHDLRSATEQLEAVTRCLREPEPRIHHQRLAREPELAGLCGCALPVRDHVDDDVVVGRERPSAVVAHLRLRSAGVREDQRSAAAGRDARDIGIRKERDIIDDVRAGIEAGRCDDGARGVDRDAGALRRKAHDLEDALELLARRDRLRPGTRRLTTDVDEICALGHELFDPGPRAITIEKASAVAERVGRDVAHAHDRHATARDRGPDDLCKSPSANGQHTPPTRRA